MSGPKGLCPLCASQTGPSFYYVLVAEGNPQILADVRRAIAARDGSAFLAAAEDVHHADLAMVYEDLSRKGQAWFTRTLPSDAFSEVLAEIPDPLVEEALDYLKPSQQRQVLEELPDDDRVDVLQDIEDAQKRENLIGLLGEQDERELTRILLKYGEDTAGGRMTTQIGNILIEMTVKEALDHLRPDLEDTETLSRIYVLDEKSRLVGKLRLRDLTFNPWQTPVRDIMQPVEHTVFAETDQEEAAIAVLKYDMLALPVVDEEKRLLGVITSDDAMEILSEESTEDIEKQAGLTGEGSEEGYLNTRVTTHFSRRVLWLVGLALLSIAAGAIMFRFEETLEGIPLLMLFLPMIIAAGGNSGGQASTVAIRAMALNELDAGDAFRVAWKELRLGAMLGIILGLTIALIAIFVLPMFHQEVSPGISFPEFGLAIAVALGVQVTASTLIGSLLPLAARAIHLDPAVIAAPAVTIVVDVSGMLIYFVVATAMLGL